MLEERNLTESLQSTFLRFFIRNEKILPSALTSPVLFSNLDQSEQFSKSVKPTENMGLFRIKELKERPSWLTRTSSLRMSPDHRRALCWCEGAEDVGGGLLPSHHHGSPHHQLPPPHWAAGASHDGSQARGDQTVEEREIPGEMQDQALQGSRHPQHVATPRQRENIYYHFIIELCAVTGFFL